MAPPSPRFTRALACAAACLLAAAATADAARALHAASTTVPYTSALLQAGELPGFEAVTLAYDAVVTGKPGKENFMLRPVSDKGSDEYSLWHDTPIGLKEDKKAGTYTVMVTAEIPRGERAKFETDTETPGNPITQDSDAVTNNKGEVVGQKLRFYKLDGSRGNYGAIPQTWEDSTEADELTEVPGDNDPVDVLDVGGAPAPIGATYRARILGCLAMIDKNETDWKLMVVNVADENAASWTNLSTTPMEVKAAMYDFFSNYKAAEGKPNVKFWGRDFEIAEGTPERLEDNFFDAGVCYGVVKRQHARWTKLVCREVPRSPRADALWVSPGACAKAKAAEAEAAAAAEASAEAAAKAKAAAAPAAASSASSDAKAAPAAASASSDAKAAPAAAAGASSDAKAAPAAASASSDAKPALSSSDAKPASSSAAAASSASSDAKPAASSSSAAAAAAAPSPPASTTPADTANAVAKAASANAGGVSSWLQVTACSFFLCAKAGPAVTVTVGGK